MRAQASGLLVSLVRSAVVLLLSAASGCSGSGARPGPESVTVSPLTERVQHEITLASEAVDDLARESHLALDATLGAQLGHVRKELAWLQRKAPSWPPSSSVEELASALEQHRALLAELRQLPSTDARPIVFALLRDLEVKAQQCRRFGGPVPVSVSVVTRGTDQQEVTGYEVWFVRKAYERKPNAARRFERHSSPAGRVFNEAGYYVLWAVPPGQSPTAASSRLDVEVGGSEREQVFDLTLPAVEAGSGPVGAWTGAAPAPGAP